jgi:HEPN domain-containing protein
MVDRARADLRAARQLLAAEDGDETIIGFHLHQAVEKALKAVLAGNEIEIPYTHDLAKLIAALSTNELDVPAGVASIVWLTPWGTTFRYEDPGNDLDTDAALEAATAAIDLAEEALA